MNTEKISLIGLGKLGLPLLLTFAKNGQKIIGIDVDKQKINTLRENKTPFFEPQLDDYLTLGSKNLELYDDFDNIINNTDVAIILVNTPSNEYGEFSNDYIYNAVDELSIRLKDSNKEDFLFIISSTVMPGSHIDIIERIENQSGRKLNNGFGLVYIPDLVALGSVIKDFENPDLIIMGESDEKYGTIAHDIYSTILKNNPPVVRMSLIESEITKVSLNAYITMKISFANFIGNIADKYECNPHNITKALGHDRRISPYYVNSGLAFGGTCFPRDTWAFIKMSEKIGLDALHIKSTQTINENQNNLLFDKLVPHKGLKIGVLGLSFKPKTAVINESPGYILYQKLKENDYDVVGYDPLVETEFFGEDSLGEFINHCEVIVLTHNDKSIFNDNIDLTNKIIINPWGLKY